MSFSLEWRQVFSNGKIVGDNIPIEQYLAQPDGVKRGNPHFQMRSGELRDFMSCPRRWIFRAADGDDESTRAQTWGSLIDTMLTMPHELKTRFTLTPAFYPCEPTKRDPRIEKPWNMNASYCKVWVDDMESKGFTVIKPNMLADAKLAVARLWSDPEIASLVKGAKFQVMVTADYVDRDTKIVVPLKTLIDIVPPLDGPHAKVIANLKTCASASHHSWDKSVVEKGYDLQAALEFDTYLCATGEDRTDYYHPIQESVAPFEPGRRSLPIGTGPDSGLLSLGRDKYLAALQRYCRCLQAQEWPGFDDPDPGQTRASAWTPAEMRSWMILEQGRNGTRFSYSEPINDDNETTP